MEETKTIKIKGDIITNDDKWIYDWFEFDSTCPKDVEDILADAEADEEIVVQINSPGGIVSAGMEIYSLLHNRQNVTVEITGIAGSAAGVISQAGRVRMHPVAMIMIHNVSGGTRGDYHDMDRMSEALREMNKAMASAYAAKSGRPLEEVVGLMDKETWITAEKAVEYGFADEVIGQTPNTLTDCLGLAVTPEMRTQAKREKEARDRERELLEMSMSLYG